MARPEEAYTRWQALPPDLVDDLLAGRVRVYLALHAYDRKLATVIVPSADRYILTARATSGRITTRKVLMTIIRSAPTCPTKGARP